MTLTIWDEQGIASHNFNPVYSFENPADKNIQSMTSGISDEKGNYYYVSYPPFSFIFAYTILKVFHAPLNLYSFYGLNLILHFITALLLYLIIHSILGTKPFEQKIDAGTLGFTLYLFLSMTAWFHGHVYFADSLIQPLWLAGTLLVIHIFWREKIDDRRFLIGFGVIAFLAVYTEWLGVFFTFTTFLLAFKRSFKDRRFIKLTILTAVVTLACLALTVTQFALISGLETFIQASIEKYSSRSAISTDRYYFMLDLIILLRTFFFENIPVLAIAVILALGNLIIRKKADTTDKFKNKLALGFLLCFPPLLHHASFAEFTRIHDFALIKTLTCLIIFTALMYHLLESKLEDKTVDTYRAFIIGITVILLILSGYIYHVRNQHVASSIFQETADIILDTSSKDDAIFFIGERQVNETIVFFDQQDSYAVAPHILLAARRNMIAAPDTSTIIQHLKKHNVKSAMVYTINRQTEITEINKIELPN
ncbi:MAG: hypothetical protein AB8G77_21995 [Rhodothermales bacterium]